MVWTRSRPYGLCHHPYTKVHIKGFGSFLFACLCLLASMLYACVSLSSSRFCHVWRPPRARPCVVTSDAHEALFRCNHLGGISEFRVALCVLFLFRSAQCYTYHACLCHPLAFYASLHACLNVRAWVLLVSVSSILQHNKIMGIWFKTTFAPRGHHLLFAFLLVCLLARLLAFLFLCLPCLSCLSALCLYHMPPFPLHVHIWSKNAWSKGTISQVQAKRERMQACRYKPSSNVQ